MVLCSCDWLVDLLHFGKKSQKAQRTKNRQSNILEDNPSAINLSVINVPKPPTVSHGMDSIAEDSGNVESVAAAVPNDAVVPEEPVVLHEITASDETTVPGGAVDVIEEGSGNVELVAAAVPSDDVVHEGPAVLHEIAASDETAVPGGAVDVIEVEDTSPEQVLITADSARTGRPASCSHIRVNSATSWTVGDDATFATL